MNGSSGHLKCKSSQKDDGNDLLNLLTSLR